MKICSFKRVEAEADQKKIINLIINCVRSRWKWWTCSDYYCDKNDDNDPQHVIVHLFLLSVLRADNDNDNDQLVHLFLLLVLRAQSRDAVLAFLRGLCCCSRASLYWWIVCIDYYSNSTIIKSFSYSDLIFVIFSPHRFFLHSNLEQKRHKFR